MPRLMTKRETFQEHFDRARRFFSPENYLSCGAGRHEGVLEELLACVGSLQAQLEDPREVHIDPRPQHIKLRPGEELALETDWGRVDVSVTAGAVIVIHKDPKDKALGYELQGFFEAKEGPK